MIWLNGLIEWRLIVEEPALSLLIWICCVLFVDWVGYGLARQPMAPPKEANTTTQQIHESIKEERKGWFALFLFHQLV